MLSDLTLEQQVKFIYDNDRFNHTSNISKETYRKALKILPFLNKKKPEVTQQGNGFVFVWSNGYSLLLDDKESTLRLNNKDVCTVNQSNISNVISKINFS